jgi:DNA-binding NtrC family response regulator
MNPIDSNTGSLREIGEVFTASSSIDLKQTHVDLKQALKRCTILVATIDVQLRNSVSELLENYGVSVLWARGMEEIKANLVRQNISACFCGFWLVDGTYRDVLRAVRRQRAELPLVVVCPPACSQDHYESLAALKIRAFDFIRHPYQQQDLERVLRAVLPFVPQTETLAPPPSFSSRSFVPAEFRRAT